jgi:hypothetical protein
MEQKPIYLCYIVDDYSKSIKYLGEDLSDCIAQLAKEYDLSKDEIDCLQNTNEVFVEHSDIMIVIEEQTLNAFVV